jgi:fucose 4-O-acetylase-like acetyltransferase
MRKDPPTFMDAGSGMIYNYIYKFVVAVIALISLFSLFRNYVNHRIRFMTTLGTYTLGIYAVHQPIMHLIADNLYPLSESPLPSALYAAALFVVLMAISVSLCILLSRNKYINGLLLGKWKY